MAHLPYTLDDAWNLTPREMKTLIRAMKLRQRDTAQWAVLLANTCGHLKRPLTVNDLLGVDERTAVQNKEDFDRRKRALEAFAARRVPVKE